MKTSFVSRRSLACFAVATINCVEAQTAFIEGDVELLPMVAKAHQANRERIHTWRGKALLEYSESESQNGAPAILQVAEISFLIDVGLGARRVFWEESKNYNRDSEAKYGANRNLSSSEMRDRFPQGAMMPPEPIFSRMLLKPDGYYLLLGAMSGRTESQLIISRPDLFDDPREIPPARYSFDPRSLFGVEPRDHTGRKIEEKLLFYYDKSQEPYEEKPDFKRSIVQNGDVVTLIVDAASHSLTVRYEFNLAQEGNLHVYDHKQWGREGAKETRVEMEYEKLADVWVPKMYRRTRIAGIGSESRKLSVRTLAFQNEMVNEPIDESEFSVDKFSVLRGTRVIDHRPQEAPRSFRYSGGSLETEISEAKPMRSYEASKQKRNR